MEVKLKDLKPSTVFTYQGKRHEKTCTSKASHVICKKFLGDVSQDKFTEEINENVIVTVNEG